MQSHIEHPGGQNRSHFMFSQKSKSHQRSRFCFATPMMVLHRKLAGDFGAKWPNWETNFARKFCKWLREKPWISSQLFNWKSPQINSQHTPNTHDANRWSSPKRIIQSTVFTCKQHVETAVRVCNTCPISYLRQTLILYLKKSLTNMKWKETCMCCSIIAPGLQVHVSISVLSLDTKKKDFQRDCQGCRPEPKRSEDESFFVSKHCAV